jgi:dipeptidyl aminopeptidase/acylaminoacyl peptidase
LRVEDGRATGEARLIRRDLKEFLPMGVTARGDLFYGIRTGATDIAVMNDSGGTRVLNTRTPGRNSAPAWSRDGKQLAYLSRRGAVNFGVQGRVIVVRDVESGMERDLPTSLATITSLRWSPNGEWLLASGSDGKGRAGLFKVRVRDGTVKIEALSESADYAGIPGDWEPDGRVVADSTAVAVAASRDRKETARASKSRVTAGSSEWSLDGVSWLEWHGQKLLATRNGAPAVLSKEGVRALEWKNYDGGPFSVHPDGKTIAFGVGEMRSEVWVMEHVFPPVDRRH